MAEELGTAPQGGEEEGVKPAAEGDPSFSRQAPSLPNEPRAVRPHPDGCAKTRRPAKWGPAANAAAEGSN